MKTHQSLLRQTQEKKLTEEVVAPLLGLCLWQEPSLDHRGLLRLEVHGGDLGDALEPHLAVGEVTAGRDEAKTQHGSLQPVRLTLGWVPLEVVRLELRREERKV